MGKGISQSVGAHELEPVSLSALIHQHVCAAIETAVHEELRAALGTSPYERNEVRRGYRNGIRERTLRLEQRLERAANPSGVAACQVRGDHGFIDSMIANSGARNPRATRSSRQPFHAENDLPRTVRGRADAHRGLGGGPALQPRGQRTDQVAQGRWLAEDRHRAQPEHVGGSMITAAWKATTRDAGPQWSRSSGR